MAGSFTRNVAVFLVVLLSVGINLGEQVLTMFRLDHDFLMLALGAIVIAGLMVHQHLLVVVLVVALSLAINLPPEVLASHHLDRDMLMVTLMVAVLAPIGARLMGLEVAARAAN